MAEDRSAHREQRPPDAGTASPAPPEAETSSFTLNPDACAADDAPTIISRAQPSPSASLVLANLVRGRRLAHFELAETIGVGGMAAVILARDLHLDRPVALKILPPEMAADPEILQRFEHESRAAARLDHENIARVYYCGHDKGLHFIAFEFVEGENVKARIERLGCIPIPEAIGIALQVASGLAHAAARGVVHRDIKPSNIIVGEDGRVKLVDMGLARSLDKRAEGTLTHSGVTLGTFDYISPEQALEPRSADVRSDLYSLGCTLYHMVTGQAPTPEGTAARKLQFHQHESPLDPRQLNPEVSDELAAIIARLLAKDPGARYQRPELLVQHLLAIAPQHPQLHASAGAYSGMLFEPILPSPPRMRPALLLASAALAVIALIAILGPYLGPDSPDNSNSPRAGGTGAGSVVGASLRPGGGASGGTSAAANPQKPTHPAVPVAGASTRTVSSVQELREVAGEDQDAIVQLEDGVYDLSDGEEDLAGLQFINSRVVLEAKRGCRPVLRYTPPRTGRAPPALTVQGGKLVLNGLRIEVEIPPGERVFHAILLQGAQAIFQNCELRWSGAGETPRTFIKSIRPVTPSPLAARLELRDCLLVRGFGTAAGSRSLDLDECDQLVLERCAFGSFAQPILLRGRDAARGRIAVSIRESLFHVGVGPFLFADTRRNLDVECTRSVFARASLEAPEQAASLLLLGRDQFERCRYRGQDNAYHHTGALLARVNEDGSVATVAGKIADFARLPADFRDQGSQHLLESPWQEPDPEQRLAVGDQAGAFRLKTTLAPLRRPEPVLILGPRQVAGEPLYSNLTVAEAEPKGTPKPGGKELVVDGVGGQPGTYRNLAAALSDADFEEETDIVVTIRWNGMLPVRPVEIGSRNVTIRAAPGFAPEFAFHPDSDPGADGEAALFRIRDGSLTLEQLRFRLQATLKETAKLQSLLTVTGTGRAKLKGCLATLIGAEEPRMALISIADPTGAMMGMGGKTPRPGIPTLELEDCMVRGQGDCVTVRVSRPFKLDVKNALIVLNGTFLSAEGNKREANLPTEGATLSMERVTAFVSQHLVLLRATSSAPVHVPLRVSSATTCLFASAEESPLLRIDGPDSEQDLKRRLAWHGKENFYSTSGSILVWQPLGMGDMPHKYDRERWSQLWGGDDDQPRFVRSIKFAGYPSASKMPIEIIPADFRLVSTEPFDPELNGRGAELDKLPQPSPAVTPGQE